MPPLGALAAFAALSFALIVVPGPSVVFVVGRAVSHGRRAALITVLGNATGVYVQVLLVAIGLGAIVGQSIAVFTAVKLVGAGYLAWLGIQAIRNRRNMSSAVDGQQAERPHRGLFMDGFVVGVANPKAIVFFAAILPQHVRSDGAPAGVQMAFLGVVFVLVALVSDSMWGLAAGTARKWLARSPRRLQRLGALGGVMMIGLGINLALSGRKD